MLDSNLPSLVCVDLPGQEIRSQEQGTKGKESGSRSKVLEVRNKDLGNQESSFYLLPAGDQDHLLPSIIANRYSENSNYIISWESNYGLD